MRQPLPLVTRQGDRIAFVAGLRTPFARQATDFHGIPAVELDRIGRMAIHLSGKHRHSAAVFC